MNKLAEKAQAAKEGKVKPPKKQEEYDPNEHEEELTLWDLEAYKNSF